MNFDEEQRTTECNGKTADFYAFIENLNVKKCIENAGIYKLFKV